MKMNWILPIRAIQVVLAVAVLGLMAYGTLSSYPSPTPFPSHQRISRYESQKLTSPCSLIMVVNSLAAILPDGDQLPHPCACMESARPRSSDPHFPRQILTQRGYRRGEVGAPRT